MASISPAEIDGREMYKYIIGSIVPRPIAWVATRSSGGVPNLAPFSFFNGCTYNPPTLAFTCIDRDDGMKDTPRNISEHPEFIVHIVSEDMAEAMNTTCADFGADIDEFGEAGLSRVPGTVVDVPRVAEAMVAFECKLSHHIRLGEQAPRSSHILGTIVHLHIDDRILDPGARNPVRPDLLRAVGRMGGIEYARTTDRFEIPRPVIAPEDPRSIPSGKAAAAPKPAP